MALSAVVALKCAAQDFKVLCADRVAVERVYYNHRIGEKSAFEQAMPAELVERLVREDLAKEAALKKVYGVEMTPSIVDAEVKRIDATTRAPDVLAELKSALGNDPARFARTVAKPVVVERLLRDKFENDDSVHAGRRRGAENARESLLTAQAKDAAVTNLVALLKQQKGGEFSGTTWLLTARPAETNATGPTEAEVKAKFGAQAQIISPANGAGRQLYFEDLPPALQNVLRVQLRKAGDVSAVIEMPGGFLLFLVTEKTDGKLSVEEMRIPKRSYEEWLAEQGTK